MSLFNQLFDQVPREFGDRLTEPAALLNSVVVEDRRLAALDRDCRQQVDVTVINSTGAGGITAVAGRSLSRCRPVAVQNVVRDQVDLLGNIARIAAAARELDADVSVLVDIPYGFGFEDAVAAAEAEGLVALTTLDAPDSSAARLSAFIEADLPFVVDGIGSAADLLALLTAVDSLIEDADVDAAAALLAGADHDQQQIANWEQSRVARVRRRLRTVRTTDLPSVLTELGERNLI